MYAQKHIACLKTIFTLKLTLIPLPKKVWVSIKQFKTIIIWSDSYKGRHQTITRTERICRFCNSNTIENEYDLLVICEKYIALRTKYIQRFRYTWLYIQTFERLLHLNKNTLSLSNFVSFVKILNTWKQFSIISVTKVQVRCKIQLAKLSCLLNQSILTAYVLVTLL